MAWLIILVLVLGGVLVVQRIERHAARASERHPVCAKCGYAVGGWRTPTCPECGADVREVGVRVGSSRRRAVYVALWLVLCVIVGWPLTIAGLSQLLVVRETTVHVSRHHQPTRMAVLVETDQTRRDWPPALSHDTAVVLTYVPPGLNSSWINGRYAGPGAVERELTYDEDGDPPGRDDLDAVIREIGSDTVDDEQRRAFVADVESMLATLEGGRRESSLANMLMNIPTPGWGGNGGSGGGEFRRPSVWSWILSVLVVAGAGWIGGRQIAKRCRPAWRAVRDDEWTQLAALSS